MLPRFGWKTAWIFTLVIAQVNLALWRSTRTAPESTAPRRLTGGGVGNKPKAAPSKSSKKTANTAAAGTLAFTGLALLGEEAKAQDIKPDELDEKISPELLQKLMDQTHFYQEMMTSGDAFAVYSLIALSGITGAGLALTLLQTSVETTISRRAKIDKWEKLERLLAKKIAEHEKFPEQIKVLEKERRILERKLDEAEARGDDTENIRSDIELVSTDIRTKTRALPFLRVAQHADRLMVLQVRMDKHWNKMAIIAKDLANQHSNKDGAQRYALMAQKAEKAAEESSEHNNPDYVGEFLHSDEAKPFLDSTEGKSWLAKYAPDNKTVQDKISKIEKDTPVLIRLRVVVRELEDHVNDLVHRKVFEHAVHSITNSQTARPTEKMLEELQDVIQAVEATHRPDPIRTWIYDNQTSGPAFAHTGVGAEWVRKFQEIEKKLNEVSKGIARDVPMIGAIDDTVRAIRVINGQTAKKVGKTPLGDDRTEHGYNPTYFTLAPKQPAAKKPSPFYQKLLDSVWKKPEPEADQRTAHQRSRAQRLTPEQTVERTKKLHCDALALLADRTQDAKKAKRWYRNYWKEEILGVLTGVAGGGLVWEIGHLQDMSSKSLEDRNKINITKGKVKDKESVDLTAQMKDIPENTNRYNQLSGVLAATLLTHGGEIGAAVEALNSKRFKNETERANFKKYMVEAQKEERVKKYVQEAVIRVFKEVDVPSFSIGLERLETSDPDYRDLYADNYLKLIYRAAIENLYKPYVDRDKLDILEKSLIDLKHLKPDTLRAIAAYVKVRKEEAEKAQQKKTDQKTTTSPPAGDAPTTQKISEGEPHKSTTPTLNEISVNP